MKKICVMLMCCTLVVAMMLGSTTAYATTKESLPTSKTQRAFEPTERFVRLITDYFNQQNAYTVFDEEENNISDKFYSDNINNYKSANFNAIRLYVVNNVSYFSKTTIEKVPSNITASYTNGGITPYATERKYVKQEDSYIASANSSIYGTISIDCTATLTGSFVCNYNTGVISSYSGPTLSFSYEPENFDDTSSLNVSANNISTSAKISSNKYSITFTAYYDVTGTYNTFAPFTFVKNKGITITGTPN